jgi:superfamily II DNA/RNA helicase
MLTMRRSCVAFLPHISQKSLSTRQRCAGSATAFHIRSRSSGKQTASISRLFSTKTDLKKSEDQSAASKSRAPFRAPSSATDDGQVVVATVNEPNGATNSNDDHSSWKQLGLYDELVECLQDAMKLPAPTLVQKLVIPELLHDLGSNRPKENEVSDMARHFAFLASTGSGKTLAYALPVMHLLKQFEREQNSTLTSTHSNLLQLRPKQRPRAIVLAPTRELCLQIHAVIKHLSHFIKLSVQIATGSDPFGKQRQKLLDRPIDVLVATPGRLWKHVEEGNIVINNKHLKLVVLDEMDTMIEQGFSNELQQILYPVLYHERASPNLHINADRDLVDAAPSVILTSATLTQSIQKMIGDDLNKEDLVNAKKLYSKVQDPTTISKEQDGKKNKSSSSSTPGPIQLPPIVLPKMKVMRAPGLHKVVPRLKQVFVDTGNSDKMTLLVDILSASTKPRKTTDDSLTMVFCNTAASCRAVEYGLSEANIDCKSYHGDLNSIVRSENLEQFRKAKSRVLVCTDLAARGIDIPTVDHVVMFDFPLNAMDYLHRSGRTARLVAASVRGNVQRREGKVTALVSKRDQVLAAAIERAVIQGEPLDGLSSRKTDYLPGGRLDRMAKTPKKRYSASSSPNSSNSSSSRTVVRNQANRANVKVGTKANGKTNSNAGKARRSQGSTASSGGKKKR